MADIKIISPAERYKAIADAIREKNGTTGLLSPADMPQAILDIVGGGDVDGGGGGVTYTNIVYNEDNTITLTDKDGVIHTMECEYTEGKLTSVKYDGKKVDLTYNGDVLVKVGKTAVDVANAQISGIEPLDHTVTFTVDGDSYEVVSVKDGNQVNEPTEPKKEGMKCVGWSDGDGNAISFPITPNGNMDIIAKMLESLAPSVIEHIGLSYDEYPYVVISLHKYPESLQCWVYCFTELPVGEGGNKYVLNQTNAKRCATNIDVNTTIDNVHSVVVALLSTTPGDIMDTLFGSACVFDSFPCYSNFDWNGRDENTTLFV